MPGPDAVRLEGVTHRYGKTLAADDISISLPLGSATAVVGILLATIANSMPQFALLAIPVFITMMLLSGTMTPLESMPQALQTAMHVSPSIYFVQFAQSILYRGAGFPIVWEDMAIMAGLGVVFLGVAITRFRRMLAKAV